MVKFGTDGIRGKANLLITTKLSYDIGAYLASKNPNTKIVVGYDTRESSEPLANSLLKAITSHGGHAINLGVIPTPAVAYVTKKYSYDYGIMISASHNPYQDNGIKILDANGFKISSGLEDEIAAFINSGEQISEKPLNEHGKVYDDLTYRDAYVTYLKDGYNNKLSLNVLIDAANGSASSVIHQVLEGLHINATVINAAPDGVNINTNCGSTHLTPLKNLIQGNNAYDLALAFDGDADRILFVNKDGSELDGDHMLYLLGKYYNSINSLPNKTVVTTIMANYGLIKALDNIGVKTIMTSVGDKYVQKEMVDHNYLVGGEQSGHIIYNGEVKSGDGIYTMLKVFHILGEVGVDFATYVKEFKKYPQTLVNVPVANKKLVLENSGLLAKVSAYNEQLKATGRVLVRASGTEELVRVMVEDIDAKVANDIALDLVNVVKSI